MRTVSGTITQYPWDRYRCERCGHMMTGFVVDHPVCTRCMGLRGPVTPSAAESLRLSPKQREMAMRNAKDVIDGYPFELNACRNCGKPAYDLICQRCSQMALGNHGKAPNGPDRNTEGDNHATSDD